MADTMNVAFTEMVFFTMIGVSSAYGLTNAQFTGGIGLAPNQNSNQALNLFISSLVSQDLIPSATFGMSYFATNSGQTSSLYFGSLNPAYATSKSQLTWTPLLNATSQLWQV